VTLSELLFWALAWPLLCAVYLPETPRTGRFSRGMSIGF